MLIIIVCLLTTLYVEKLRKYLTVMRNNWFWFSFGSIGVSGSSPLGFGGFGSSPSGVSGSSPSGFGSGGSGGLLVVLVILIWMLIWLLN